MQLHLKLTGNNLVFPINYRHLIHGMIYKTLSDNSEYSKYLHDLSGSDERMRTFKKFTFSSLIGEYRITGNRIVFENAVFLEIRSCDPVFINVLYRHFLMQPEIVLGKNCLYVSDVFVNDFAVYDDRILVKMKTPVVAYFTYDTNHTYFYSPNEDAFYRAIERNAERKWEYMTEGQDAYFHILPAFEQMPKMQKSSFKNTYITGWFGRYFLQGDPVLLNLLYDIGLGAKNPEGYGMFDCIPDTSMQ